MTVCRRKVLLYFFDDKQEFIFLNRNYGSFTSASKAGEVDPNHKWVMRDAY